MSRGWWNFRFGNARTTLKGGGGSGVPTTREAVQGVRPDRVGPAFPGLLPLSAARPSRVTKTDASMSARIVGNRRLPPGADDGMSFTPKPGPGRRVHSRAAFYSVSCRSRARILQWPAAIPSGADTGDLRANARAPLGLPRLELVPRVPGPPAGARSAGFLD